MKIYYFWVYYGFPNSSYEGINVEEVRYKSGYRMGKEDSSQVDSACGIPDSGIGQALGYAEGMGVPYHRAITKYTPTLARSFTPPHQDMRSLVAKMKLIPNSAYNKMVQMIQERFGLTSLRFNTLETLIGAIGLPKCKLCTHCFDGSSHF